LYDAAAELGIELEVVAAYDSWPKAVAVYNANMPHPVAEVCDLKTLQRADLPPHDLIIGGPPCQDHSMAGKRACKCNVGGEVTERCCLADFVRLAGIGSPDCTPYLMENVAPRLIPTSYSVKLCAADFGDVTSRKRWFYSNYLLHVIETPGPRRIRDIRDHAEDERVLAKRSQVAGPANRKDGTGAGDIRDDADFMANVASGNGGTNGQLRITCKAGAHGHYDSEATLDSVSAHSWHGHDIRGSGKLLEIVTHRPRTNTQGCEPYATVAPNAGTFGSLTADAPRAYAGTTLRLGLRGNSASAFEDDAVLGSVMSNSFHANEASRIVACRNPSLLEMQRAHSFPDSFDWCGATKTDRGKMIANSWPRGLGKAVCKALLAALERKP
jgi:site-specific DNA-cytosine methylase